jgi:hypothetical protein
VISRVIAGFQLQLPIQTLFDSPTVAAMSAVIASHEKQKASEEDLRRLLSDLDCLLEQETQELAKPLRPKKM